LNLYDVSVGEQCPKYVLDLRTSVAEKHPDGGTFVPKRARVGI